MCVVHVNFSHVILIICLSLSVLTQQVPWGQEILFGPHLFFLIPRTNAWNVLSKCLLNNIINNEFGHRGNSKQGPQRAADYRQSLLILSFGKYRIFQLWKIKQYVSCFIWKFILIWNKLPWHRDWEEEGTCLRSHGEWGELGFWTPGPGLAGLAVSHLVSP